MVAVAIAVLSGGAVAAIIVGESGCHGSITPNQVAQDLSPAGACALPIVVNGLLAGQPVAALIDAALQCAGATIAGLIQIVTSLEGGPPPDAAVSGAALSSYRLGLAQLHTALLARQAAGAK